MEEKEIIIDNKEVAEYIFKRLIAEGVAVMREDIDLILSLEMDYMIEKGLVEFIDE